MNPKNLQLTAKEAEIVESLRRAPGLVEPISRLLEETKLRSGGPANADDAEDVMVEKGRAVTLAALESWAMQHRSEANRGACEAGLSLHAKKNSAG